MRENKHQSRSIVTLDRPQLVGLGFFAVLSGGLMFGLGYSAGKTRGAKVVVAEERPLQTTLQQIDKRAEQHEEIKQDVDLTFYKQLVEKEEKQRAQKPEPQKTEVARLEPPPAKVEEKKVEEKKPVKIEEPALTSTVVEEEEPRSLPVAKEVKEPKEPKEAKGQGAFTIQVSAFRTQLEAASYVKLLSAKGFNAHIKAATVEGKDWYRVRVGNFASATAAQGYKDRLTRENLPAWIVKAD